LRKPYPVGGSSNDLKYALCQIDFPVLTCLAAFPYLIFQVELAFGLRVERPIQNQI
jgi:hypothetical protein